MTLKQIEEKADLFLKQDNENGLLGLCKICYSMGMVEMQKIKDFEKEHQEEIKENDR